MSKADPRVDAYLAKLAPDQQRILSRLRADVARLLPDATETISCGMPAFRLDGHFLLSYAGWSRHCSVYPISDGLLERHAALAGHERTKGSLHFTEAEPLPPGFLEDLVRARVRAVSRVESGGDDRIRTGE